MFEHVLFGIPYCSLKRGIVHLNALFRQLFPRLIFVRAPFPVSAACWIVEHGIGDVIDVVEASAELLLNFAPSGISFSSSNGPRAARPDQADSSRQPDCE